MNETPVETTPADLDAVCRTAARLFGTTHGPLRRIKVRSGDIAIEVEWSLDVRVAAQHDELSRAPDENVHYVCAPMVGTFHRTPQPGAKPFVTEGDIVEPGQQIGILEAMKLMNTVESTIHGQVVEILVADAGQVEYDQPLVALTPLEAS